MRKQMTRCLCFLLISTAVAWGDSLSLPSGTVLYLSFDNAVTPKGFVANGTPEFVKPGVRGGCLYLDGMSWLSAVSFPAGIPTGDAPYTVSSWVRRDSECRDNGGWISYGSKPKGCGNSIRYHGIDRIHNYFNNADLTVSAPTVGDGLWHQVVVTWDGNKRRVYADGVLRGEDEQPPNVKAELFLIGRTMHDVCMTGWLDEVLVLNRALSTKEVALFYRDQLTPEALSASPGELPQSGDPALLARAEKAFALSAEKVAKGGWSISFQIDTTGLTRSERILDCRGGLRISLRFAGENSGLDQRDNRFGNYLNFPCADHRCPVLEAEIRGVSSIGIPLALLTNPYGKHEVTIQRMTNAFWTISVDGNTAYDEDSLRERVISWPGRGKVLQYSSRISNLHVTTPAKMARTEPDSKPITRPIQFWTPDAHNVWVGDVVIGCFRDRCHIFYLLDRRHHKSKEGTGGHYFAHISSKDMIQWEEHPVAVPIDEWWQTVGTGTPFVWKDRFYLSYGLHTTRFMPQEQTCEGQLQKYFADHGQMGVFPFSEVKGFPIGGSYAVSDDGIHFTRSRLLFHSVQNPTVYNRTDGLLGCVNSYGGRHGIYVSDHVGDWKLFDEKIPIRGDCPCEFEWNGHHYLIQGFRHTAYNEDGRVGGWVDWSTTGDDVYDGLSVPMVTTWKGNRRIMAGWISHPCGWGGWLAFHELVQYPDGKLGVKWLPETPPPGKVLTYTVQPGAPFAVRFPKEDGGAVEFRVESGERRAQWADVAENGVAPRQMTQAEWNAKPQERNGRGCPCGATSYAVQNIRGLDKPYTVRLAAYFDKKSGCTLFDAEIAESRAMICRRPGKFGIPVSPQF